MVKFYDTFRSLLVRGNAKFGSPVTITAPVLTESSARAGAGAIDISKPVAILSSAGATAAVTLADGQEGQTITLLCTAWTHNITVTPTNYANGSTLVFKAVGDVATLYFHDGDWYDISKTLTA